MPDKADHSCMLHIEARSKLREHFDRIMPVAREIMDDFGGREKGIDGSGVTARLNVCFNDRVNMQHFARALNIALKQRALPPAHMHMAH